MGKKTVFNRLLAKSALLVGQSSWLTILGGYLIWRSQWVVLPTFIAVAVLMTLRCKNCGTSFQSDKIYSKFKLLKFYDTSLVDACPVCKKPTYTPPSSGASGHG